MATVTLENVEKIYPGKIKAVLDFSLEVPDGEFVVLVGPSGCGKSTTLRMIAGLEETSAGKISIGERVVNDVAPKDRDVAMVFQNYALYPHMTVRGNMAFGLKLRKLPKAEVTARIQEAAAILGLTDLLDRRPKSLSGGQRQRVAVGRAIVRQPAVFLFDEPLSNLDAKLRAQMRVEIIQLHAKLATTMIYVTHDQTEAMTMGDRIVVMDQGIIQQVADPMTLYDRPENLFVAGFIGTPPMNFFSGSVVTEGGSPAFRNEAFTLPLPGPLSRQAADAAGREVVLGLRPEDIGSAAAEAAPDGSHLTATVDVVEPMGAESYVHARVGDTPFVARVDAHRSFQVGREVSMGVFAAKAHLFDAATQARIGRAD